MIMCSPARPARTAHKVGTRTLRSVLRGPSSPDKRNDPASTVPSARGARTTGCGGSENVPRASPVCLGGRRRLLLSARPAITAGRAFLRPIRASTIMIQGGLETMKRAWSSRRPRCLLGYCNSDSQKHIKYELVHLLDGMNRAHKAIGRLLL